MQVRLPVRFGFLRALLFRPTARNMGKVLSGNILGNGLHLVALVILGRDLPIEQFGLYLLLHAGMMLMAQVADFGLNTTLVKQYQDHLARSHPRQGEILLRHALQLKMVLAGVIAVSAALVAGPVSAHVLDGPDATRLFRIVCLGAWFSCIWYYCQASLQARQRFGWHALLTAGNHALRLMLITVLWLAGRLTLEAAVWVLVLIPLFGSTCAALLWPGAFWRARSTPYDLKKNISSLFHFSKWIFLSSLTASIILRVDIFLLGLFSDHFNVGQFGVAERFAGVFPLIAGAVSSVLLPRFATIRSREQIGHILDELRRLIPMLAIGLAVVMLVAHPLIPFLMGAEFQPSVWVFDVLALGFSLAIVLNPLSFFCLSFDRPHWITYMCLCQLVLNVLADVLLIPSMGAIGAAYGSLLVRIFALFYLAGALRRLLRTAEP